MKATGFALRPGMQPRYCPESHIAASAPPPLRVAFAEFLADVEFPSGPEAARRALRSAPAAVLAFALVMGLLINLARDRSDVSEIELVMLQTLPEVEAIAEPEPEVIPEPEPVPEVEPVVVEQIAKAPEPPAPPPVVRVEPPRPEPPPVVQPKPRPQIVAAAMPKPQPPAPQPVQREVPRPVPTPTQHRLRPPVEIAAAPEAPVIPKTVPTRVADSRAFRAVPAATRPVANVAPVVAREPVLLAEATPPTRTRQPRSLPISASREQPVAPLPVAMPTERIDAPAPEVSREPRRQALPTAPVRAAMPRFDVAVPTAPPQRTRTVAVAPARAAVRPAPPAKPAPSYTQVSLAPAPARNFPAKPPPDQKPQRIARAAVPAAASSGSSRDDDEDRPRGVPLGSLASCVSDREETALKQALLSSVKTQKECISDAGHYRFLQTRNFNAFLMWVAPASNRTPEDRCIELAHALDCVKKQNTMESRKR